MDDPEYVSGVERVNDSRKDEENHGHGRKLQDLKENQVNHMV
jgi:hypothetical protein